MYNESQEENKLLKAQADKYKRRAEYAVDKFKEIKAKEL